MEGVLLIATIAQRWKMRLAAGHVVEPKPMITLRPKYGMRMIVESREFSHEENANNLETLEVLA
jgi:hypothetical protein